MLIKCKECNHDVSDKAFSCPNCGFPLSMVTLSTAKPKIENRPKTTGNRRHRKLPNGFGSIQKLSGKRRRPYAAYPHTTDFALNGSKVARTAIGYFDTWHNAYAALSDYNRLTEEERKAIEEKTETRSYTFSEIYQMYYADKFKKEISEGRKQTSMMVSMRSAYKNSSALHDRVFSQIYHKDFQDVVDRCPLKHASKELIVTLFKQMSKFAMQNNLIDKEYAQYVKITSEDDDESGVPFLQNEIDILWNNSEDEVVQFILIMIYSGFRISAFETIKIDLVSKTFTGGVKTKNGKNRIVPIHSLIYDFVKNNSFMTNFSAYNFRNKMFYEKLEQLGILFSESGTKHTPHDCRHTFSWLADKYKMDEISKHMIMGHSLGSDVEKKVYGHRTIEELKEEMEKIKR